MTILLPWIETVKLTIVKTTLGEAFSLYAAAVAAVAAADGVVGVVAGYDDVAGADDVVGLNGSEDDACDSADDDDQYNFYSVALFVHSDD
jgi:hypothetical protein